MPLLQTTAGDTRVPRRSVGAAVQMEFQLVLDVVGGLPPVTAADGMLLVVLDGKCGHLMRRALQDRYRLTWAWQQAYVGRQRLQFLQDGAAPDLMVCSHAANVVQQFLIGTIECIPQRLDQPLLGVGQVVYVNAHFFDLL